MLCSCGQVLFQDLFPAAVAGAAVTLTRRSPEQSVWLTLGSERLTAEGMRALARLLWYGFG